MQCPVRAGGLRGAGGNPSDLRLSTGPPTPALRPHRRFGLAGCVDIPWTPQPRQLPHAGARIAPLALRELTCVYPMRIELESLAARLAALTITDEDLERIRVLNARMRERCDAGELGSLRTLNRELP